MSGGWKGSTRRDRLPSWWPVTVRRIIARDPVCRCTGCPKCTHGHATPSNCVRTSTEADHIVPGDDHRDVNLRGICQPCHRLKSSQEGNAAKRAKRAPRPSEKHPGDLT